MSFKGNRMKICTIVGARPQFVKAAVVSRVIVATDGLQEVIVHTGQHYDANMSDRFFDELDIPRPSYNLNIGSSSHGKQTGQMLTAIEEVVLKEKPDWVLIYGDTNSTLAGALAAAKLHIPVAHVEAGLRSFNRKMPEEINRITSDHLSTVLFPPTETSYKRLLQEGIDESQIFNVGDVMYDAALYYNERNAHRKTIVDSLALTKGSYILATIHRAENTDSERRIKNICTALIELTQQTDVVLPLHPRTYHILEKLNLLDIIKDKIKVIEPVGYLDMLALEQHASLIITDSGGVQKEAYFNQVPCITLRDETEWVELVESGWNVLCSPDDSFSLINFSHNAKKQNHMSSTKLYGNGDSAQKIIEILRRKLIL
jgi:UDP-GlcNAc3NAcA epimerase